MDFNYLSFAFYFFKNIVKFKFIDEARAFKVDTVIKSNYKFSYVHQLTRQYMKLFSTRLNLHCVVNEQYISNISARLLLS